jgi:predicted nucleotidyltransferase
MIPLQHDLKEFLRLLSDHHVEYLLIGGYAVSYHGYPRTTDDMDIWIERSQENAEKMIATLEAFGFGGTSMKPEQFLLPDQITRMGNRPLQIEILTTISGLDFAAAYAKRVVDAIDGVSISLISSEDLKTNKRASGRLKDLADLDNLP